MYKHISCTLDTSLFWETISAQEKLLLTLIKNKCINDNRGTNVEGPNVNSITSFIKAQLNSSVINDVKINVLELGKNKRPCLLVYCFTKNKNPLKSDKLLLINGHLDVVPATKWRTKGGAFVPHIDQEKIYGRGAFDMLGYVTSAAQAFVDTVNNGTLSNPTLLCFVPDEENAGLQGSKLLVQDPSFLDLIQPFNYVLGLFEGGGYQLRPGHFSCGIGERGPQIDTLTFPMSIKCIPVGSKRYSITIECGDGHGSMTDKTQNPIESFATLLKLMQWYYPDISVSNIVTSKSEISCPSCNTTPGSIRAELTSTHNLNENNIRLWTWYSLYGFSPHTVKITINSSQDLRLPQINKVDSNHF